MHVVAVGWLWVGPVSYRPPDSIPEEEDSRLFQTHSVGGRSIKLNSPSFRLQIDWFADEIFLSQGMIAWKDPCDSLVLEQDENTRLTHNLI